MITRDLLDDVLGDPIDTVYDFVFIDADKENVLNYFLACLPLVRKGGILFFDNAVRGGR